MLIIILINIGFDQISKSFVRDNYEQSDQIEIIESFVLVSPVQNKGIMFGIGGDLKPLVKLIFFTLLPLVAFGLVFRWIIREREVPKKWTILTLGCIIGGGIGNIIDRIKLGSVTDFLIVKAGNLRTGVFNFADISITVGILVLIYLNSRPTKLA